MNNLSIIGNVTNDAIMKSTQTGISVTTFTVAVNPKGKDKNNKPAQFFRVTAWRALAETAGKYVKKGMKIYVNGPVELSSYEKDGEKRYNLEVTANEMEFLSRTDGNDNQSNEPSGEHAGSIVTTSGEHVASVRQSKQTYENEPEELGFTDVSAEENDDLPF